MSNADETFHVVQGALGEGAGDGACGARPHHHVTLEGTIIRRPTFVTIGRPVCEVQALFVPGIGDALPICFLEEGAGDGACGVRPHHNVTLKGTITRKPAVVTIGRPVCEARALVDPGTGDAPPICFSMVITGPPAKTCRSWVTVGATVQFAGVLVRSDFFSPRGKLVDCTYCGVGGFGVRRSRRAPAEPDGDAGFVELARPVLVGEVADRCTPVTPADIRGIVRGAVDEFEDVILGGPGNLPRLLAMT